MQQVVDEERSLAVDVEGTLKRREEYRRARIARGRPFDAFCKEWGTAQPPEDVPYFGCWDDRTKIYATSGGQRIHVNAGNLQGGLMRNPKAVRIAALHTQFSRV